jgi:hypothetical protein
MGRTKIEKVEVRNEEGVKLKKNGEVDKRSENGLALVKNGTFLQKKVVEAVQESKKVPETIDEGDESDSSQEDETEFEITNVAEKKELDDVVEEKVTKKLEFIRDTEEKTKKFLEEERKAREDEKKEKEELKLEKERLLREKEDLAKERDELRRSLEPVERDFATILNENRKLRKLKQENDHLSKISKMTRKYIQL